MLERRISRKIAFDIKVLIIGSVFSLLIIVFQLYEQRKIIDIQTRDAGNILTNKIRAKIEVLEHITNFLKEVSVANKGNVSREAFEKISKFLYSIYSDNEITGIFYLNQGRIQYVYPIEGNRATLGIDILKREERRDAALLAIEKKQSVLSGPYNLYQGKRGLIIRNPIFIVEDDIEKFVGFSVITIKFPSFINNIALNELENYNYKISTILNGEEKLIVSKGEISDSAKAFTMDILNSNWKVVLEPKNTAIRMSITIITGFSLIVLTLLLANLSYRYKEEKVLLEEMELDKKLLILALENTEIVIFIYNDESKKISFINKRGFLEEYGGSNEISSDILEEKLHIEEGKEELYRIFSQIKGGKKSATCVVKKRNKVYGEIWERITLVNPFVEKYRMKKIIGIVENITPSKRG